jgi:hypothetical protein
MLTLPITLFAGLFAGPQATDEPAPPSSPPPQLTVVKLDGDRFTVWRSVPHQVTHQVPVEVEAGGRKVKEVRTITKTEFAQIPEVMLIKDLRATRADGGRVDPEKLPELLRRPTAVVLSSGPPIDPVYLRALRDDTLILSFPGAGGGVPIPPDKIPTPPPLPKQPPRPGERPPGP